MSRSRTAWIVSLLIAFSQSAVATRDAQSNRNEPMGQPQIDRVAPREDGDRERIQAPVLFGYVVEKIADTSTPLPAGTGAFAAFGVPSIDGGTVAFRADGDMGQKGVYALVGNTLTKVANLDTPVPGGGGQFHLLRECGLGWTGIRLFRRKRGVHRSIGRGGQPPDGHLHEQDWAAVDTGRQHVSRSAQSRWHVRELLHDVLRWRAGRIYCGQRRVPPRLVSCGSAPRSRSWRTRAHLSRGARAISRTSG